MTAKRFYELNQRAHNRCRTCVQSLEISF
jgi:hypothetical protein